jgi:hypothetical protein
LSNDPFTAARDELSAQLAAAQAEMAPLRAAVEALRSEDEAAGLRLYQISSRAAAAVRDYRHRRIGAPRHCRPSASRAKCGRRPIEPGAPPAG